MNKLYIFPMALMMSLVLGSGFAMTHNTALAQNYGDSNDYLDTSSYDNSYSRDDFKPDKSDRPDFPRQFEHKFYTVVGDTVTGASGINPNIVATAECDEGDVATGGSFTLGENGNAVIRSYGPEGDDAWKATAFIVGGTGPGDSVRGSVTADVRCFDNKPFHQEEDPLVVEEEAAAALVLE
jgi:hypothetical protein